jgi:hypothetical protein
MLGFLQGLEKSVAREGAAQRQHHGQLLASKESHLDRLLSEIKYNQEMKRLKERDARQDFVTDRAYDRGVLESDRNDALRQKADARAGEAHDLNYGEGGMMRLRRDLFKSELDAYMANEDLRDATRRYNEKRMNYNLGEGWDETLEERELAQDLTRAQINAYNRRGTPTSGGRLPAPTWSQTREITVESLAPGVLKYLEDQGEHLVPPWHKDFQLQWFGFESDRPWSSEDPNEVTQTQLLRQAGGHLVEELIARGVDPQTALTMVPFYWDQIIDTEGSDVFKRLKRTAEPEGYDDLELRKVLRDSVYQGAMNFLQFKNYERPQGATGQDADKLLDTIEIK